MQTTPTTDTDTSETSDPTEPPDGLCGDITEWDLTVVGDIVDWRGEPYDGVEIRLDDRGWVPGTIMGTGATDATGRYTLDVEDLTSVEDCWGTLLDYVIVATAGDLEVEEGVNSQLYGAIADGTLTVDLTIFPLVLE